MALPQHRQYLRYARPDPKPGPVTGAFNVMTRANRGRPGRFLLRAWPAVPVLALIPALLNGHLTRYADSVLGYDALLCLTACLAVTPLITVAGAKITVLRLWYGLWLTAIAGLAVLVHFRDLASDAVLWTGLMIAVLLIPLTVSSGKRAQKLLGREWKRHQRPLVWAVWTVTVVHLAALSDWITLYAFATASLPLIVLRYGPVRRKVKQWRSGGYSTGGMWVLMTVGTWVFGAGLLLLSAEGVLAVARAAASG